jgi:hypothetical protein
MLQQLAVAFGQGVGTPMAAVRPVYGIPPFAGLNGIDALGLVRGIYIFASLGIIICLVSWGLGQVLRMRPWRLLSSRGILQAGVTALAGAMTLFHLSIESLDYYDRTIPLANYQDRFAAPLWPMLLLLVPPIRIRWWMVGGMMALSVVLSLWWGRGYLMALATAGHPLTNG